MKPVFKSEHELLEKELGIKLPRNIWRKGKKLYIDTTTAKPFLSFKVSSNIENLYIDKNKLEEVSEDGSKAKINGTWFYSRTFEEEVELYNDQLDKQLRRSMKMTKKCLKKYNNKNHKFRVSISGGKDSDLTKYIVDKAIVELDEKIHYDIDMFNTTNETPTTYKYVKNEIGLTDKEIHTPKQGWYKWLEEDKNYYIPSVMVRNCCSTYKEGKLKDVLNKKGKYVLFIGTRSQESSKRSHHDWYLNPAVINSGRKPNVPMNWNRFLPIVKWSDVEVWLFIIREKLNFNPLYEYGYNRVGCLICPFSTDYADFLTKKYYPYLWNRWTHLVKKNYETYRIGQRLKWTEEEWINGKWKQATSREQELIQRNPTNERIQELAKIKGISFDMASKYFKKKCSCGKKLNPTEIAMFLKVQGRYEGKEDNRKYLCKNCMCDLMGWSKDKYKEMQIKFSEQGCELF